MGIIEDSNKDRELENTTDYLMNLNGPIWYCFGCKHDNGSMKRVKGQRFFGEIFENDLVIYA